MTIGEFAQRTRLSPKALRIYAEMGLVVPMEVDGGTGYRHYREDQVQRAKMVGMLRRLDMPLSEIARVVDLDACRAADALQAWWASVEAVTAERRALVAYLMKSWKGDSPAMQEIALRTMPERTIASIQRHVRSSETDAFFDEAFATLRALGPAIEGVAGAPYLVFYGEVSEDSDGPVELCRPLRSAPPSTEVDGGAQVQLRVEPAHDEAFVRLAKADAPAIETALDAIARWATEHGRRPSATFRQLLIWDQREAAPHALVCDVSVPLQPA